MGDKPETNKSAPTPGELREQMEGTREKAGQTVEGLVGAADKKIQQSGKATAAKARAREAAGTAKDVVGQAGEQARLKTQQLSGLAEDRVPEPVREKAAALRTQAGEAATALAGRVQEHTPEPVQEKLLQVTETARKRPGPVIAAAAAALLLLVTVRRGRKRR